MPAVIWLYEMVLCLNIFSIKHKTGINISLRMDDKSTNDDEDSFLEMRMAYYLCRFTGFDLVKIPPLGSFDILQMATVNVARVCHFEGVTDVLKPGMKADLLLMIWII